MAGLVPAIHVFTVGDSRKAWKPGMTKMRFTLALCLAAFVVAPAFADPAFDYFLQSVWPDAQKVGVTRATFDTATHGLEPDLSLQDLVIAGRPEKPEAGQAEFVLTPSQYLRESTFDRLATQGRALSVRYRDTLTKIEREFGVPGNIVLAIFGRETDYGRYKLPYDAIRVLATQAYTGRRKEMFRGEFIAALKMLQDGVPRAQMRSSWGGAMGMTQFLPSEYYKYAVDFDGDGKADIWNSVPDALAAAAKQLLAKGWQTGLPWAIEVRAPGDVDCTLAEPNRTMAVADWLKAGYVPSYPVTLDNTLMNAEASLLLPEGTHGPAFLTPKNYYVIKAYNFSDLYALFVGHLADRIGGARAFATRWSKSAQLRSADVATMQQRLIALGFYKDKVDGKAGMLTRAALGAYQKAKGLKVDCWPTAGVLGKMR
jgi:lytic murein transglycosylase